MSISSILDNLQTQVAIMRSFPYRTEYLTFWKEGIIAGFSSPDARTYAQQMVDDLRAKHATERVADGGLDVRVGAESQPESQRYDPADYLTQPLDPNPPSAPRQIRPFGDHELIDASKRVMPSCSHCPKPAPEMQRLSDLFARPKFLKRKGAAPEVEDEVKLPAKSAIPSFIKKPHARKARARLEDKWAGTLTDL